MSVVWLSIVFSRRIFPALPPTTNVTFSRFRTGTQVSNIPDPGFVDTSGPTSPVNSFTALRCACHLIIAGVVADNVINITQCHSGRQAIPLRMQPYNFRL